MSVSSYEESIKGIYCDLLERKASMYIYYLFCLMINTKDITGVLTHLGWVCTGKEKLIRRAQYWGK